MSTLKNVIEMQKRQLSRYDKLKAEIKEKLTQKITYLSRHGELRCIYTIQEYTFGYPRYNVNDITTFLSTVLINEGFCVVILTSNKLFISWDINDINNIRTDKIRKKTSITDLIPLMRLK